ncbi:hypothetical protein R3P38DRAFT_3194846 [Favolaschia claudopus]|uniref:Uncharacterized protein n=1 Tax=Favolaschia claudopus TaxID=2862362 RepID=A0AAW0BCJ1_9AGAR
MSLFDPTRILFLPTPGRRQAAASRNLFASVRLIPYDIRSGQKENLFAGCPFEAPPRLLAFLYQFGLFGHPLRGRSSPLTSDRGSPYVGATVSLPRLQDASPGSVRFHRTRGCFGLVCHFLNAAVLSYPPFWTALRIDMWSTKYSVDHSLARNAGRPMTVIVVDSDPSVTCDADDDSMSFNPGTRSIHFISAFDASLGTVRLWSSLTILSPYPSTVEYLFSLIHSPPALALSGVRVACLPWIPGPHCIVVGPALNPSALTHLRFEGFGVYKFPIASCVSLQVLRLVDLPIEAPSFA